MPVLPRSGGPGSESVCAALTGGSLSCLPPERSMHSPYSFKVQALLYTSLPLHPSGPNLACLALPCPDGLLCQRRQASLLAWDRKVLQALLPAHLPPICFLHTPPEHTHTLMHTSTCTHRHMQCPYACLHTRTCTHTPKACSSLRAPYSLKLPACTYRLLLNLPGIPSLQSLSSSLN